MVDSAAVAVIVVISGRAKHSEKQTAHDRASGKGVGQSAYVESSTEDEDYSDDSDLEE
eukprot:COSAG05_NODE_3998_length_1727_cov_94.053669_3_plen_58_part_00